MKITKNIDICFGDIDGMSLKKDNSKIIAVFGYGYYEKEGLRANVIILSFFRIIYYVSIDNGTKRL